METIFRMSLVGVYFVAALFVGVLMLKRRFNGRQ